MVLLVGHGVIHTMGRSRSAGLADLPKLTGAPAVDVAPAVTRVLASAWLVALAVLVAAGWGLATRRSWWRRTAVVGVVVSQLVIVGWWTIAFQRLRRGDAATGTIPDLLIVSALALTRRPHTAAAHSEETTTVDRASTRAAAH